ncbi:MAG: response regulator [Clostridia bacterium]|nr:response regulator [Clostridia bacterium]
MRIICVDDEHLALQDVLVQCRSIPEVEQADGFTSGEQALEWLAGHPADIALLDIDMPGMDGIELAIRIKETNPETAVIFLTAYSQYAVQAFSLHASGYLLKPVDREKLADEFAHALRFGACRSKAWIEVRTFGGFDVFADGKQVTFRKAKCKELLAFLIDKQGSTVTRAEAFFALWEDRVYDRPMQKQLDTVIRMLRETLREYGIEDMFSMKSGTMRIVPDKISCDAYRLFSGDPDAVNSFHGTYMNAYSWASITEGYLSWKVFGSEGRK